MQFMLRSPLNTPLGTLRIRLSWMRSSTRELGRLGGIDLHQVVLGDVELLQLPQGAEGLLVYLRDFVVHQDESLRGGGVGGGALEVKAQLPGPPSPLLSPLSPSAATWRRRQREQE